ncbi:uncharacterized protein CEXT_745201 [Caerostris extrusa]|uniref:RRM domain-containing protein n=1 Tax=Caerostris extrusa TaxID=172846 RepID=A0AAV4MP16_CAEEX|nr:uncharacterized protein CEXT_745201 [Caerostris extrusa]
MAYFYKINDSESADLSDLEEIKVHKICSLSDNGPCIKYDFSKYVLIELLDKVTPETKLWAKLGLIKKKNVTHKYINIDPHRDYRRAIVVCTSSKEAKELAMELSQLRINEQLICAVVIQQMLSDICLFENRIIDCGDKRSQYQLVHVTGLNVRRKSKDLVEYLTEIFSPFGTILSIYVSDDKNGYAYPEGVIRFAYLSEAFAAELGHNQSVITDEYLSVVMHHNVLLAQCDLRTRLKEAYEKKSKMVLISHHSEELKIEESVDNVAMVTNDNSE